jgi:uncharacterized glyoxalase superfamily protein PhnB
MSIESLVPLINVEDVQRSIDFYTGALGFTRQSDFADAGRLVWARLACGPVSLMLNGRPSTEAAHRRARPGHHDVVLYMAVPDVEPLHASLVAAGHDPSPIENEAYGLRQFGLRDPDGYELAFTSPLER